MKKHLSCLLSILLIICLSACSSVTSAVEAETPADTIYTNALFYTEDEENPQAEAMAVRDGKIVYVGDADTEELAALTGSETEIVDLGGAFVTPNLLDAHTHPTTVALSEWYTDLPGDCDTLDEILEYIRNYCGEHPVEEQGFIYFEYYPSNLFDENGPQKEWLDEVTDRPVLVEDFSDHACWVNSAFLENIGLEDFTDEDLAFVITDANGEYTGWILEGVWQGYIETLYENIGYRPDCDISKESLSVVLDDFKSWGITGCMDALIQSEESVAVVADMVASGELGMYYEMSYVLGDYSELDEAVETIHYLQKTYGSDNLSIDTMKIFYDGTNELGDAALVDGTIEDPDDHGYLMMDLEETTDVIRRCNEEGIDVHFHMVGDLAFRNVCDATEALIRELGGLDIQVEMCHCEYINPEDYERPAELGIIVNWTPHWSGGYFGDASRQYLGEERYNSMYQFNPLIESGAVVTFGSDIYSMYEEERANPYFSMQIGMTRVDIWDGIYDGMRESEDAKLSLEDLLKGYTINAAIQMRIDDRTGSLTVGKNANFNVYSENLFDVDAEEFRYVLPAAVYFEGNLIAENGNLT